MSTNGFEITEEWLANWHTNGVRRGMSHAEMAKLHRQLLDAVRLAVFGAPFLLLSMPYSLASPWSTFSQRDKVVVGLGDLVATASQKDQVRLFDTDQEQNCPWTARLLNKVHYRAIENFLFPPVAAFWPYSAGHPNHRREAILNPKKYCSIDRCSLGLCFRTFFSWGRCLSASQTPCGCRHTPLTPYEISWICWLGGREFVRRYLLCFLSRPQDLDRWILQGFGKESDREFCSRLSPSGWVPSHSVPLPGFRVEKNKADHQKFRYQDIACPLSATTGKPIEVSPETFSALVSDEWTTAFEVYAAYWSEHDAYRQATPFIPRELWKDVEALAFHYIR
ncbi:hypothetical protein HBH98_242450 [Parastagonospora nodorum]|nr:hypothetical protein HBH53_192770 [Parastagonospora nodorum]KAH3992552.1 hypothetical protein HBI10_214180 [Parastagonospora nodorum]KAH4010555.1 hypothetical protein HBI13_209350 [Parastagonospora nodorum]KAH4043892.1 hypothetical protein HBH49_227550 [Parastagonospora nodorum]KAH4095297.1 hypothetical protein HBH46_171850 [Parastagonospora nodorum]